MWALKLINFYKESCRAGKMAEVGLESTQEMLGSVVTKLWSPGPFEVCQVLLLLLFDADPGQQDLLLWLQYSHTHGLQKYCGGKGAAWAPDPLLDRLLLFFWAHYMRAILIYHAQVHHRWLPFKEDKGQDTANYFKEKDVTAQGRSCSHSILGWFSTDFRKMKILR